MYIYEILNTVNNKRYIGQSIRSSNKRLVDHKYNLKCGIHPNLHLQNAWNKYGESSFTFTKLEHTDSIEKLAELEIKYIEKYDTLNRDCGYNIDSGGLNRIVSEETKVRIGDANRGNYHTKKQKALWAKQKRMYEYPPVISPDGKKYIIDNLHEFCRKHNLDRANMGRVLRKKSHFHKGWKLWDSLN